MKGTASEIEKGEGSIGLFLANVGKCSAFAVSDTCNAARSRFQKEEEERGE